MDPSDKKLLLKKRIKQTYRFLAIGFSLLIGMLFLLHVILPDTKISETEKRTLARRPELSGENVFSGRFSDSFEEYASDQMPFRGAFVKLKTATDLVLGKRESQGVYRCKGGSLIEKTDAPDYDAVDQTIGCMKDLAASYPSEYTLILFPNAATVDSEKLPAFAPAADQTAFFGKVLEKLAGSPVRYMDLSDEMRKAKETNGQVFYRTDHHWTTETAYFLAPTVLNGIGVSFDASLWSPVTVCGDFMGSLAAKSGFGGTPDTITVYRYAGEQNYLLSGSGIEGKIASVYSEEGLRSSDPYTVFLGGNDGWVHVETDHIGGGRLLVFKNSYFNSFLPFLLDSYETVDVVDPRYFCEDLQSMLLQNSYDDIVFFYDMNSFAHDTSLSLVLGELGGAE